MHMEVGLVNDNFEAIGHVYLEAHQKKKLPTVPVLLAEDETAETRCNGVEDLNRQVKHTYRRLSGCGSLANTLYTVTQEFVPDMLGSYIQRNYTSSKQYRLYSPDVSQYLRNRPKDCP